MAEWVSDRLEPTGHSSRTRGRSFALITVASASRCLVFTVMAASMSAAIVSAQVSGGISGTVKDTTGGVVPGVTVTATNVGLGTPFSVTTNSQGFYSLPKLPVGRYDVLIQLEGFKPQKQ